MGEPAAALQLAGWLFIVVCLLVLGEYFARRGQHFNPLGGQAPSLRLHGHCRAGLSAWSVSCPLFSVWLVLCWPCCHEHRSYVEAVQLATLTELMGNGAFG